MKVSSLSLDIESTIADVWTEFQDRYEAEHGTRPEQPTDWEFSDSDVELREFHERTGRAWKRSPNDIEPIENFLAPKVYNLYQRMDTMDIVTGRRGHDQQLEAWLHTQGLSFDDFRVVEKGQSKADLGYTYYVDDKPELADEIMGWQELFLFDQPYNRHIDTESRENVVRVKSLRDVNEELEYRNEEAYLP